MIVMLTAQIPHTVASQLFLIPTDGLKLKSQNRSIYSFICLSIYRYISMDIDLNKEQCYNYKEHIPQTQKLRDVNYKATLKAHNLSLHLYFSVT